MYRNLHKKTYSIKQKNKVIGYGTNFTLWNCKLIVSKLGRERVLKTKRKNVHAFIEGFLIKAVDNLKNKLYVEQIKYDPYQHDYFFRVLTKEKIEQAECVLLHDSGAYSIL